MKKLLIIAFSLLILFPATASAQAQPLEFSVFTREDCAHCQDLEAFLEGDFAEKFPDIKPKYYDLADQENYDLFTQFCGENDLSKGTPKILIGGEVISGFISADTTGTKIIELAGTMTESEYFEKYDKTCTDSSTIVLPFFGEIDPQEYSLATLAIILGFVDGFNPCAMWVLIMFLTLLLQAGSRRKMIELAGMFIIAETVMYYLILNVWYKTWDFVKLDQFVTPIIGLISIGAGIFFLYEFFTNKSNECKVTSFDQKRRLSARIKELVDSPFSIGIFFATLGLAFSVNIIEFACSIGIPQAFTKILELNNLSFALRQLFTLIYTFFYMIDDFLVFGIALWAFQYMHLTTKYTRYCLVIGGVAMLVLGYFFIFDPSKLVL
ncbi:MAG: glutaredoxin [Candidatus Gracilibacteria bacterium]|jgi:hypothetical protein